MLNEIQNKTGRGYQLYIVYKYERSSDSSKSTEKTEQEASSN